MKHVLLLAALTTSISGCGGGTPPPQSPASHAAEAPTGAQGTAPTTFAEQVALGQKLYGEQCATCHGASGEGGRAPRVVGLAQGALPLDPPADRKFRHTRFKTVADVADFVVHAMPPKAAGSLSADDYLAILAFDLKANGIDLGDRKLDMALAPTLTIPR